MFFRRKKPAAKPTPKAERLSLFSTEVELPGPRDPFALATKLNALFTPARPAKVLRQTFGADGVEGWAQDDQTTSSGLKNAYLSGQVGMPEVQALWYASQGFIGYQMCAVLAQHWLIDKACLAPARDAIRKGYKFTVNDGTDLGDQLPAVLDAITQANKRFKLNKNLVEFVRMGRVFGIRVAIFKVASSDPDFYVRPFNPDSIEPGTYRGISQVDPYWMTPELSQKAAADPDAIDFYEPTYWVINGQRYHKSHLVIMRGPEVADILKPSYLYGGLSIPQRIYERVYAAERTANEAPQLAMTKRLTVFYTDAAKALQNFKTFMQKLSDWVSLRDNYGVKVADKEADKIEQTDTSLADLDAVIMSQYQLVASIANVPVTKLLGTTPKGFNSSGEYEQDSYHEELESIQTADMEPLIDRHMVCLIRSEIAPRFTDAPFSVSCVWEPLATMTPKELADVNLTKAQTDKIYAVDIGAVDGGEVRSKLSADETSGYEALPVLQDADPAPTDEVPQ